MVSQQTNFGERSEPAPDRGGKLQLGGAAQSNVSPLTFGDFICSRHSSGDKKVELLVLEIRTVRWDQFRCKILLEKLSSVLFRKMIEGKNLVIFGLVESNTEQIDSKVADLFVELGERTRLPEACRGCCCGSN